jgi:hypothetical protein
MCIKAVLSRLVLMAVLIHLISMMGLVKTKNIQLNAGDKYGVSLNNSFIIKLKAGDSITAVVYQTVAGTIYVNGFFNGARLY